MKAVRKSREKDPIATVRDAGKSYVEKFNGNWAELMKDMNRRTAARQKVGGSRGKQTAQAIRKRKAA